MQILIYHGKHGNQHWLADTDERLNAALRILFQQLDEWGCYDDSVEGIHEARVGNIGTIKRILTRRSACEYEEWDLEEVVDPCTG